MELKTVKFIGQDRIWKELEYILPNLKRGENINLLLKAQSGYGKTLMGGAIIGEVAPNNYSYIVPDDEGRIPDLATLENKRIVFIDEIHTMKQFEIIYPFLSAKKQVYILATNESGKLSEALIRRCRTLVFQPYTKEELRLVAKEMFEQKGMELKDSIIEEIADNSNGTPGTIESLRDVLYFIFKQDGIPSTREKVREYLVEVLDIQNGLDPQDREYIRLLKQLKRASLKTMVNNLNLDETTICRFIEPKLIKRGYISITPRGRIWNDRLT